MQAKIYMTFKRKRDDLPEDTIVNDTSVGNNTTPVDKSTPVEDGETSIPPTNPLDTSNTITIDNSSEPLEHDPGK